MPELKSSDVADPVLMVSVTPVLCVMVPVKPVQFTLLTVMAAEITAGDGDEAVKNTSSVVVGTDWFPGPPSVAAQLVFAVAFQLVEEPPPTQYREAI